MEDAERTIKTGQPPEMRMEVSATATAPQPARAAVGAAEAARAAPARPAAPAQNGAPAETARVHSCLIQFPRSCIDAQATKVLPLGFSENPTKLGCWPFPGMSRYTESMKHFGQMRRLGRFLTVVQPKDMREILEERRRAREGRQGPAAAPAQRRPSPAAAAQPAPEPMVMPPFEPATLDSCRMTCL